MNETQKTYHVGLDIGYSDVKAAVNNRAITFPSMVGKPGNRDLADLSKSSYNTFMVTVGNEEYLIGNSATRLSEAIRRETRDYQLTEEWYALFLAALTELQIPSGAEIIVATGLPVSFWTKEAANQLKDRLEGQHEVMRNGMTYRYRVAQVLVTTQFYGSAMAALVTDNPVAPYLQGSRPVAIVDGGGRTVNFGVVTEMSIVPNSTFSKDLGSWSAVKLLSQKLTRKFGRTFPDNEIMEALRTKLVWHYEECEVKEEVEEVLATFAEPILRVFDDEWEKVVPEVSAVFFTGGTPLLLTEHLSEVHRNVFYGGAFDNALGYKYFAEMANE